MLAAGMLLSILFAAVPPKDVPSGATRLLIRIAGGAGADGVRATVENLGAHPVAMSVVPAFVLRPSSADEVGWPAFRAPVDTGSGKPLVVNGLARLQLAPSGRQTVVVPLESLYWDHYESVIWPSRPLRRVVLPGRYDVMLEIREPDSGFFWRSDPIPAVVKKTGSLELVKPE